MHLGDSLRRRRRRPRLPWRLSARRTSSRSTRMQLRGRVARLARRIHGSWQRQHAPGAEAGCRRSPPARRRRPPGRPARRARAAPPRRPKLAGLRGEARPGRASVPHQARDLRRPQARRPRAAERARPAPPGPKPSSAARARHSGEERRPVEGRGLRRAGGQRRDPGRPGAVGAVRRERLLDLRPAGWLKARSTSTGKPSISARPRRTGRHCNPQAPAQLMAELGLVEVAGGGGVAVERPPVEGAGRARRRRGRGWRPARGCEGPGPGRGSADVGSRRRRAPRRRPARARRAPRRRKAA